MSNEKFQPVIHGYVSQYIGKVEATLIDDIDHYKIDDDLVNAIGLCWDWMVCSVQQRYAYTHLIAASILYRRSCQMRWDATRGDHPLNIAGYEQTRCDAETLEDAGHAINSRPDVGPAWGPAYMRLRLEMGSYKMLSPRADGVRIEYYPIQDQKAS